jgi:hypothetical protein
MPLISRESHMLRLLLCEGGNAQRGVMTAADLRSQPCANTRGCALFAARESMHLCVDSTSGLSWEGRSAHMPNCGHTEVAHE